MSKVGQREILTQKRVIAFFKNAPSYAYLGNWQGRAFPAICSSPRHCGTTTIPMRAAWVRNKIIPLMRAQNGVDPEFEATEDYLRLTLRRGSLQSSE